MYRRKRYTVPVFPQSLAVKQLVHPPVLVLGLMGRCGHIHAHTTTTRTYLYASTGLVYFDCWPSTADGASVPLEWTCTSIGRTLCAPAGSVEGPGDDAAAMVEDSAEAAMAMALQHLDLLRALASAEGSSGE